MPSGFSQGGLGKDRQSRSDYETALGVPEVWRFHPRQARLWFGRLEGGSYVEIDQSLSLPMLTPQRVLEALNLGEGLSESEWDPLLRAWVAAHLARSC